MGVKNVNFNHNEQEDYFQIASGQPKWASVNKHNTAAIHADLTVEYRDTDNANPNVEYYKAPLSGKTIGFHTAGYNTIRVDTPVAVPATVWVWGAGGGYGGAGGPDGGGGAGDGIRGTISASGPYVAIVGKGGFGFDNPNNASGSLTAKGWPDGGLAYWTGTPTSQAYGYGGGRSSFGAGPIPYANRDTATGPTAASYLLIGGGGGGGSAHMDSGTIAGQAGRPSGSPGGGYYPGDGSASVGGGGSDTAGGSGGTGGRQPNGVDGAQYFGGPGGTNFGGGGGGGGFFGGGGAGGYYAGGGGGSSHVAPGPAVSNDQNCPVSNYYTAGDDPGNPGTKPAGAGNGGKVAHPQPSTTPAALGGPGGSDGIPGYIQITFN